MKSTLQITLVLVLLNTLALTLWSRAAGPPPATPAARPTRIAVLNLTYVIKNYEKFQFFQQDLKKTVDPFQDRDTKKKKAGEALEKQLKAQDLSPEERAAIERKMKRIQREIEDNKAEAQRVLMKKQENQLKMLYRDIEDASRRLAQKRGYDLILHYNDALTAAERNSPANIARKMQAGALMPLVADPGIDVSQEVLEDLHKALKGDRL